MPQPAMEAEISASDVDHSEPEMEEENLSDDGDGGSDTSAGSSIANFADKTLQESFRFRKFNKNRFKASAKR